MTDTTHVRPMLATEANLETLRFPVLVSPKLDGVRAIVHNSTVYSRSGKAIPNRYIQETLGRKCYDGLDGELIVGSPTDRNVFSKTTSGVMTIEGQPGFSYHVFDIWNTFREGTFEPKPYSERLEELRNRVHGHDFIYPVEQMEAEDLGMLLGIETYYVERGYEGAIIRSLGSGYKNGRSTQKEQFLLKMKRFKDAEAEVIGVQELQHNDNEVKVNGLGYSERSTAKSGLRAGSCLGALVCRSNTTGVVFNVGSGFTGLQRQLLWSIRGQLLGKQVKYKYFDLGVVEAPRHPVFLGFRDEIDMEIKDNDEPE